MPDAAALQYEVADIVGLDAWKIYEKPDGSATGERHLIPEAVMLEIASSLVGEFLKGLLQPEALGLAARHKLGELYTSLKNRSFGGSNDDSGLIDLLHSAQAPVAQASPEELQKAEDGLAASLRQFGLDESSAKTKAAEIRTSVLASLAEAA